MSEKLKIALVGCGGIAKAHLRGIREIARQIDVAAAVDIDFEAAKAFAYQTGAQPFCSLEEALEKGDFDAVDIMLPHALHEEAALLAFEAGKHVVMEKPMATSLEACERILAAARAAQTVFMIAEQSQYWPDVKVIQDEIANGAIGDLIAGRAFLWHRPRRKLADAESWRNRVAATGGGICIDGGAHWIRPMRIWFGEIQEVVAALGNPLEHMEGESLAHGLLRFHSGTVGVLGAYGAGEHLGPVEEFRITGSEGEILVERAADGVGGNVTKYVAGNPAGIVLHSGIEQGRHDSFGYELSDFADAILKRTRLQASPEDSLGELRTALAMYRSTESGHWESVW